MLQSIEVGEKYPGKMREGVFLEYNNGFTLYIFIPNITRDEAESLRTGKYKFAITEISDVLFFLYEFKPAISISDVPFHFGIYNDNRIEKLPDINNDPEGLPLQVIAVDSASGSVEALRLIGLGTRFSKRLIDICRKQATEGISKPVYDKNIISVQRRYQAKDLLRFSTVICK